jgi:hypothetical protein
LGLFTKTRSSHARLNVPAGAGGGVRHYFDRLDLLMILNQLGIGG